MLLDTWMPRWDARSHYAIDVAAPPDVVFEAILHADFSRNPVIAALMAIRAVPAFVFAPKQAWQRYRASKTPRNGQDGGLLGGSFVLLESKRPAERILGLTGRFWSPAGGLAPSDPSTFRDPVPQGFARAAWNFHLEPIDTGTRLATETRVVCGDARSRRNFLRYWRLISVGSGLIRLVLLRQIKKAAERAAALA